MSERCKHVEKNGFNCGSYAFNLYKDGIDQGNLCDVHYWQAKALAQPEQEPVAWINVEKRRLEFAEPMVWHTPTVVNLERIPLYTHQRTWVGLTDEEMTHTNHHMVEGAYQYSFKQGAKWAEAKLKEKNT